MKTYRFLIAWIAMLVCSHVLAQTDFTSCITNPSFESGMTGWTYRGLQTQTNSVFDIKAGEVYLEKWTGRGGAVGSASLSQTVTGLKPGRYELSAVAQNIQEDTPTAVQTGACIFAGDNRTAVTVRSSYTVGFSFVAGEVTVGFEAVNASGNWIAVDNFRLTKVSDDLSELLAAAIEHAVGTLGDGNGKQNEQLKNAIESARKTAAQQSATGQQQADAIVALEQAEGVYLRANASAEHPLDLTSLIVNPSFETGDFTGWTQQQMALQTNNVFSIKQATYYAEKWVSRGNAVGDALVSQRLSNMAPGQYRLKVAAQNIQENTPNATQTGAEIFANTNSLAISTRKDYTLEFVLVSDQLEIGFKASGASGNWISIDNFRLEYIGDAEEMVKNTFETQIKEAEEIVSQRMSAAAQQDLQNAISIAKPLLSQGTTDGWDVAARQLEAAMAGAKESIATFKQLKDAIATAQQDILSSSATQTTDFQAAIDKAQGIYDSTSTTDAQALAAVAALDKAAFAFKIDNGSGAVPTVVTDPRFIKGSTWAFGRSTVSGSNIIEQGFCWSENPDPQVTDNRTTEYLNQAGRIYWLRNLKPATMYYMRAYAITKDYAVGYGDVIKFSTVPKGTITHWYNNGGDEDTNNRINYAIDTSMDYYWNNLTSIHGFGITVNYSPGTPTADCSYGGWMRVGANSSYQHPGTIMHEALHGIGVGTHGMWWSADMRADGNRGVWLGDRVTEAVRFWDNNPTATITGDDTHLWPYGCNGANEDSHSDNLYCMMGILAQALNEDGLPGSEEIGYALPYYSFNHEDNLKYYIKSESENHGLRTAYLVETTAHNLEWQEMTAEEAADNDAAAWYISFTPANQYYQIRNAKTGYYITYASTGTNGIRTANHSKPQTADNFHLMRGRVDVASGRVAQRGYYIIHPERTANPAVLNASSNGKTNTAGFNIAYAATAQRWLILTADEALNFDTGGINLAKNDLQDIIDKVRKMAETPHAESTERADEHLSATLQNMEALAAAATTVKEIRQLITDTRKAGMDFLEDVVPLTEDAPFDLTFLITNPDFNTSATDGWNASDGSGYAAGCVEYYERAFDFYQTLTDMPAGSYELRAQAFQRTGEAPAAYTAWNAGTAQITTSLYVNSTAKAVKNVCDDAQPQPLLSNGGWGDDKLLGNGTYIPNCMDGTALYFAKGLYDSEVEAKTDSRGDLRIGIRCTSAPSVYWTIFDHFRLYYHGNRDIDTAIDQLPNDFATDRTTDRKVYDMSGRRVVNPQRGLYIINGQKVYIK